MKNIIYIGMIFFLGLTFEMKNSISFQKICLKSICYLTIYVLFEILKNNFKFSEKTKKEFFKKVDIFIFGLMIFGLGKISRRMIDNNFIEKDIILVILWVVIILIILLMILLKEDVFSFLKQENNEKLFPSRIIEGAILEEFLESDEKSLLVDGKWGIGKTYFVKKVINEKEYNRIDLDILIFNTREKLAEELMNQLREIFKENNIFSPNLSDLGLFFDESSMSFKKMISKWLNLSNSFKEAKENLKDEIEYLMKSTKAKKIIIFCDNLERIMGEGDNKEWKEMVAFLHDLSEMKHLKLIVAADYEKLRSLDENSSDHSEYFEKFYDRYIKLTEISPPEILEKYSLKKGILETYNLDKENLENIISKIKNNFSKVYEYKHQKTQDAKKKLEGKYKSWKLNRKRDNDIRVEVKDQEVEYNQLKNELTRIKEIKDNFDLKVGNPRIINKLIFEIEKSEDKYEMKCKIFKIIYPAEYSKIINEGFGNFILGNSIFEEFFKEKEKIEMKDYKVYDNLMISGIRGLREKVKTDLDNFKLDKNYQDILRTLEIYKRLTSTKEDKEVLDVRYIKIYNYILTGDEEKNINELLVNDFIWEMEYPTSEETEKEKKGEDLLIKLQNTKLLGTYEGYRIISQQILKPFWRDIKFLANIYFKISSMKRFENSDRNFIGLIIAFDLQEELLEKLLTSLELNLKDLNEDEQKKITKEKRGNFENFSKTTMLIFKDFFENYSSFCKSINQEPKYNDIEILKKYLEIITTKVPEMILKKFEISTKTRKILKKKLDLFCKRTANLIKVIMSNKLQWYIEEENTKEKTKKEIEKELEKNLKMEKRYELERKLINLKNILKK